MRQRPKQSNNDGHSVGPKTLQQTIRGIFLSSLVPTRTRRRIPCQSIGRSVGRFLCLFSPHFFLRLRHPRAKVRFFYYFSAGKTEFCRWTNNWNRSVLWIRSEKCSMMFGSRREWGKKDKYTKPNLVAQKAKEFRREATGNDFVFRLRGTKNLTLVDWFISHSLPLHNPNRGWSRPKCGPLCQESRVLTKKTLISVGSRGLRWN